MKEIKNKDGFSFCYKKEYQMGMVLYGLYNPIYNYCTMKYEYDFITYLDSLEELMEYINERY